MSNQKSDEFSADDVYEILLKLRDEKVEALEELQKRQSQLCKAIMEKLKNDTWEEAWEKLDFAMEVFQLIQQNNFPDAITLLTIVKGFEVQRKGTSRSLNSDADN